MIARYSKIALLAFVCFPVAAANAAETSAANACTKSRARKVVGDSAKIRTTVKNEAQNKVFSVKIKRNGKEVKSGTLNKDSSQVRYTMGVTSIKDNTVKVDVEITGFESLVPEEERTTICKYQITYDDKRATWSVPTDDDGEVCSNGIEVACEDCELECSRNFVEGDSAFSSKNRWTTTFTISD